VTQGPARASDLDAALRRVQRGALLTLAACAVLIAVAAPSGPGTPPARGFPIVAIALALGAVVARQASAAAHLRARVTLALASLLLAACIGLVGVALALQGGPRGTALAYCLGGAILCLRPPARLLAK
jgi:peptidoglycan/LPS O-acetylase OafA/YrhL